jgi:hypothetical protein
MTCFVVRSGLNTRGCGENLRGFWMNAVYIVQKLNAVNAFHAIADDASKLKISKWSRQVKLNSHTTTEGQIRGNE